MTIWICRLWFWSVCGIHEKSQDLQSTALKYPQPRSLCPDKKSKGSQGEAQHITVLARNFPRGHFHLITGQNVTLLWPFPTRLLPTAQSQVKGIILVWTDKERKVIHSQHCHPSVFHMGSPCSATPFLLALTSLLFTTLECLQLEGKAAQIVKGKVSHRKVLNNGTLSYNSDTKHFHKYIFECNNTEC